MTRRQMEAETKHFSMQYARFLDCALSKPMFAGVKHDDLTREELDAMLAPVAALETAEKLLAKLTGILGNKDAKDRAYLDDMRRG